MTKTYEAPELILVGSAAEVVMGAGPGSGDFGQLAEPDFEFEQD